MISTHCPYCDRELYVIEHKDHFALPIHRERIGGDFEQHWCEGSGKTVTLKDYSDA